MKSLKPLTYLLIILLGGTIIYTITHNKKEHISYYSGIEKTTFTIATDRDNILVDSSGIVLFIPPYAFKDTAGDVITDSIEIEFRSISNLTDLIGNGINTSNPNLILNSETVFYFEAQHPTKTLTIDPEKPIYIELPSPNDTNNRKLFQGEETDQQIHWQQPHERVKYLIPFDLEELDFYPPGFEETVENNLPFRDHYSTSCKFLDSLYYSFAVSPLPSTHMETAGFFSTPQEEITTETKALRHYGINPASIAALKSRLFENTYISTGSLNAG